MMPLYEPYYFPGSKSLGFFFIFIFKILLVTNQHFKKSTKSELPPGNPGQLN